MSLKTTQIQSLKNRITLLTLGIFLISIWSLAFYANRVLYRDLEVELSQQQFSVVSILAGQINSSLKFRLESLESASASVESSLMSDPRALQQKLNNSGVLQSLFNGGTFVTDINGTAIASLPVSVRRIGVNYMERDHVAAALKEGKSRISKPVIGKLLNTPVVSMAVPVRDSQGKVIGALVGVTDLGKPNFLDQINVSQYGRTGGYFVTSRTYRLIISASDKSRVMEQLPAPGVSPMLDRFLQGHEGSGIFINPRGIEVLASARNIPVADWYLAAALPTAEAFAPVHNLQQRILYASLILTLLAGVLTWWVLRRQLSPILKTTMQIAAMARGEQSLQPIPVTGQDEVANLIGGFNSLIDVLSKREEKIRALSNMYAALSQCNHAIVHSRNEVELFQIICSDVVNFGGMKMAWIGMLDEEGKWVNPVASFGSGCEYLDGIKISTDAGEPTGRGPTGTSIREARPFWCQDFQHDPATSVWHERGSQFGWGASASMPLKRSGIIIGAFTCYAAQAQAFNTDLQNLLLEMAADISFALDNFDKEARRASAEASLREHDEMLKESQFIAGLGSYVLDFRTGLWESSEMLDYLLGIDERYVRSVEGWERLIHPDDRAMMDDYFKKEVVGQHKEFSKEYRIIRVDDKTERWVQGLGRLECSGQGELLKMTGTIQDITTRKLAEAAMTKLSFAVEQSPNSIVITDLEANIEYVNRAYTKITGYRPEEVMGRNPRILQSGKTPKAVYDDMWAHLTRGEGWAGELFNRRKDGSEYVEFAKISPVRQENGQITHYLAIKEDLTEKRSAAERIDRLSHFDQLTGLPNLGQLKERFKYAISLAQRSGESLAVIFLDLDHFKDINDTLGHSVGDQVLMEIGKRIKESLREEDAVSRQGGDEFILLLPGTDAEGAALVASKLMEVVAHPIQVVQHDLITTASIGIAIYPHDGENLEILSKNADTAMYRVKQELRNGFRFFTQEMQAHSSRILQLSNALRHALARNELSLYYQPQLSIEDGHLVGAEALLRWHHPELGMISPAEFIPIAETSGQIIQIGEWVLRTATKQLREWLDNGMPAMVIAVNLSAVQFKQPNIAELITNIIDEVKLPHECVEVELTEAVAMDDPQSVIDVMDSLHATGIRMSIDDFGTGYSSLSYLKKFKVYKLKIDQSFVRNLSEDPEDRAIVSAIINLATGLGLHTIAEGVETASQLAFLRMQGCDEVQGYYFSKPLPADQFEKFVNGFHKAYPDD